MVLKPAQAVATLLQASEPADIVICASISLI